MENKTVIGSRIRTIREFRGFKQEEIAKAIGMEISKYSRLENDKIGKLEDDILKIAVVNRYQEKPIAVAFIKNFGLKRGALASSVAHDSHNIIVVGVDDESMCKAANAIIAEKGGLSVTDGNETKVLPLPVAGLMSTDSCETVAENYLQLVKFAKEIGCTLHSPFMSLSFMALLVIPSLKLSDKGLFDGNNFKFCDLGVN